MNSFQRIVLTFSRVLVAFAISLAVFVICSAEPVRGQSDRGNAGPDAPILPMDIRFRYASQYFMQLIEDDPRYSEIEAVVEPDLTEVILTDKATNTRAFYSRSQRRVDALHARGAKAYLSSIELHNSPTGSYSSYWIRLQDNFGQGIGWHFVVDKTVPEVWPEVVWQPNKRGVVWIYAPHRAAPAADTAVNIGGKEHPALASIHGQDYQAMYAQDLTLAEIMSGERLWSVESSPTKLTEGAEWDLKSASGLERKVSVRSISECGLSIEQVDQDDTETASLKFGLEITKDGYSLSSVSITAGLNTFWIFFGPGLPLPSHQSDDENNIAFSIAENERAGISRGNVAVHRSPESESIRWNFEKPKSVRANGFVTTVNVIWKGSLPGNNQASCATADSLVLAETSK
jgi:hypothetical protein